LNFLDSPKIAHSTRSSSFDPKGLLTGKMSIFLTIAPEFQRSLAPLARLWLTSLLRTVVKGGLSNRKVQFLLDEAAGLGHLEILDDAIDKYRSYGVRLTLIYQSLAQLKLCWPDGRDGTVLGNCTQIFFAVSDYSTAEYVSNRMGDYTEIIAGGGTSESSSYQGKGGFFSRAQGSSLGSSTSWAQGARKLLQAPEVMQLDPRIAITLHPGLPPLATFLPRYYERGWDEERTIGFCRAALDALCLFAAALLPAVVATVLLFGKLK
jgi:type IV secretion system protein VirD4